MPGSQKGKGKLTKAEKDKLKKEEEAQRLKEEEEARLAAEAEEKERLEKEKAESEEKQRLLNEEKKRKTGELQEVHDLWQSHYDTLTAVQAKARSDAKWDRYMKCDGSPDPTVAGEINTYMNLWREDKNNDINNILKESDLTLSLITELDDILEEYPPEELTDSQIHNYQATMLELQELLQQKLNYASHDLLLQASRLSDPETSNLQKVITNTTITLCMWGNLSKNPSSRKMIRSYEFEEMGFTFEIPKVLALSDCAFRVLFTKYDHLSPQCTTYVPRHKTMTETPEPAVEEKAATEEECEKAEDGEAKEGGTSVGGTEEGQQTPAEPERETTEDLMATLRDGGSSEKEEKDEEVKEENEVEEEVDEFGLKTPEPEEWEDFDGDDDVVDLRAYQVLGGIFHFNLLNLPPQPKQVNNWTITQLVETAELNEMDYQAEMMSTAPSSAKESSRDDTAKEKKEERPPIGVTYRLPEDVYFSEEPQVVRWDSLRKLWSLDGFAEHNFNEETRIINFNTSFFGTMALIQDSHINMPFQSWELRPRATNHALFTIIAAIVEVELEIKEGECMLNVPEDKPELSHFKDKWIKPSEMIKRLKAAGINVFPAPDSSKYVSIQAKNPVTENRIYQQMALTASSMAFSWSKWNSEIKNDQQVVVQATECLEDEPLLEEDWSLFMATKQRTIKLQMTEFDENFSDENAEGTEYHADLYHLAMEVASDDGKQRICDTSYKFINTVYSLLKATRIITFS